MKLQFTEELCELNVTPEEQRAQCLALNDGPTRDSVGFARMCSPQDTWNGKAEAQQTKVTQFPPARTAQGSASVRATRQTKCSTAVC